MKSLMSLLSLLLLPILLFGDIKGLVMPSEKYNEKLTLSVETPDGIKTASSVFRIEVSKKDPFGFPGIGPYKMQRYGQATMVDLGGGRYLVALMKGHETLAVRSLSDTEQGRDFDTRTAFEDYKVTQKMKGAVPVPLAATPYLVTFDDISDPRTLRTVDPADLAATFGAGYALREITLENTTQPPTNETIARDLAHKVRALGPVIAVRMSLLENDTFTLNPSHISQALGVKLTKGPNSLRTSAQRDQANKIVNYGLLDPDDLF